MHRELENSPLWLPVNPAVLIFDPTWWVAGIGDNNPLALPSAPPLASDKFQAPSNIFAADGVCPEVSFEAGNGFWRPGSNRICSTDINGDTDNDWPYDDQCPHELNCTGDDGVGGIFPLDCSCGPGASGGNDDFAEDPLDAIPFALRDFVFWAQGWLEKSRKNVMNELPIFYADRKSVV